MLKGYLQSDFDKFAAAMDWFDNNGSAPLVNSGDESDDTSGDLFDLMDKFQQGEDSFILFTPFVRKTSRTYTPPSDLGTQAGLVFLEVPVDDGDPFVPPATGRIGGATVTWQWLKTADRYVRQALDGKWERVEEWTAAQYWDIDIYGSAESGD